MISHDQYNQMEKQHDIVIPKFVNECYAGLETRFVRHEDKKTRPSINKMSLECQVAAEFLCI